MKQALLSLSLLLLGACGGSADAKTTLGATVDAGAVIGIQEALGQQPPAEVTLRGEVQEVCTSMGCWFTLREKSGDATRDLHVDLATAAGFTLDQDAVGRTVVVRGKLAGDPDRELHALGLVME